MRYFNSANGCIQFFIIVICIAVFYTSITKD